MKRIVFSLLAALSAITAFGQGIPYILNKNGHGTNTTLIQPQFPQDFDAYHATNVPWLGLNIDGETVPDRNRTFGQTNSVNGTWWYWDAVSGSFFSSGSSTNASGFGLQSVTRTKTKGIESTGGSNYVDSVVSTNVATTNLSASRIDMVGTGAASLISTGAFTISAPSVNATGTVTTASLVAQGIRASNVLDRVKAEWWGADATGLTSSSLAVSNAVASGLNRLTFGEGTFKLNLTILTNFTIEGASKSYLSGGTRFTQDDPAQPILTIGNDSVEVRGVIVRNVVLDNYSYGIKCDGGVSRISLENVHLVPRAHNLTNLLITANAKPTYFIYIKNMDIVGSSWTNTTGVVLDQPKTGTAFVGAVMFSQCEITGSDGDGSKTMRLSGGSVWLSDTYMDIADGKGLELLDATGSNPSAGLPIIYCSGAAFDAAGSGQLATIQSSVANNPVIFQGTYTTAGYVTYTGDNHSWTNNGVVVSGRKFVGPKNAVPGHTFALSRNFNEEYLALREWDEGSSFYGLGAFNQGSTYGVGIWAGTGSGWPTNVDPHMLLTAQGNLGIENVAPTNIIDIRAGANSRAIELHGGSSQQSIQRLGYSNTLGGILELEEESGTTNVLLRAAGSSYVLGNVGIGTNSPQTAGHIVGTTGLRVDSGNRSWWTDQNGVGQTNTASLTGRYISGGVETEYYNNTATRTFNSTNGNTTISGTVTATNGFYTTAPTNGVAPPSLVYQPIGLFGFMGMSGITNTVTVGSSGTYYVVTNFNSFRTNNFVVSTGASAGGYLTNLNAGFYRISYYLSCVSGNSDTLEVEVNVNGTGKEEISGFATYDNPARIRVISGGGILYLPANSYVSLRVNNRSSANNVTVWRGGLTIGTP